MPLKVGEKAPDFELYGKEAGGDAPTYLLSDALARGGVVLQFFPLPFTRTCSPGPVWRRCAPFATTSTGTRAGASPYGASPATTPSSSRPGTGRTYFGLPILADYDHKVGRTYVGLYEDVLPLNLRLTTKRGVVGISRDGTVRSVWVAETTGEAPSDEVVGAAIRSAGG